MGLITASVDIERPLVDVWTYVTDRRNDVDWWKGVRAIRVLDIGEHGTGALYEQDVTLFGWRYTSWMRVVEVDPPRRMLLVAERTAVPFQAEFRFEPLHHRPWPATRFIFAADVHPTGVYRMLGPLFVPLLRRTALDNFAVLKRNLESRVRSA